MAIMGTGQIQAEMTIECAVKMTIMSKLSSGTYIWKYSIIFLG